MKIIIRGDCTSRRTVFYNKDLFQNSISIQNQKSPFVFFTDFEKGVHADFDYAKKFIAVEKMSGSLKNYFEGQFDRSILMQNDVDLLIVDNYADMNFELFESYSTGGKIWLHKSYIRDPKIFQNEFKSIGKRTYEQSLNDFYEFTLTIRKKYGDIPILFLNQQIEYYPKLDSRKEFYEMGFSLSKLIDNFYNGKILNKSDLVLADIGSCGPGLTLHYQGQTYRKMIDQIPILPLSKIHYKKSDQVIDLNLKNSTTQVLPFEINLKNLDETTNYNRDEIFELFKNYFIIPDADIYDPKFIPAAINFHETKNFDTWKKEIIKSVGDNAFRNCKKALKLKYFVEPFNRKTFVSDIYDVNTSLKLRTGRPMSSQYLKTIEDMGGIPDRFYEFKNPLNHRFWTINFGVFLPYTNWKQGDLITNQKLVGYLTVRRYGDLIFYPQILGHGDHLDYGIMALLHFEVIKILNTTLGKYSNEVKVLMYTAMNTSPGLSKWKKRAGFKPIQITLTNY